MLLAGDGLHTVLTVAYKQTKSHFFKPILLSVYNYAILSPVNGQKTAPLNRLLKELPSGLLADTHWLKDHGLTRSLIHDYVKRGWLERLGARLYRRAGADASATTRWEVAVLSAQQLNHATVHVGGPTALALLGKAHYLRLTGEHRVYLYDPDRNAPTWLRSLDLSAEVLLRTKTLFSNKEIGLEWRRIDLGTGRLGAQPAEPKILDPWDHFLQLSGEERATIEMMDEIPETVSFEHVDEIFQALGNLRPALLARLLQTCTSVKAKRLFFFFADRHSHAWWRHVDRDSVDLGKGKRQLARGGKLDPAYQITVPVDFFDRKPST